MNVKYAFHPPEYAIGENEKFYSDMAAKGWRLVTRGARLSRFERAEPESVRYRVEVADDVVFGDGQLPEDKVALFEECGWEYVTGRVYIHIFRSADDDNAPEFYMDPAEQAATLRALRRSYVRGFILAAAIVAFWLFVILAAGGRSLADMGHDFLIRAIEAPGLFAFWCIMLAGAVFESVYASIRVGALYHSMRRGKPLDHSPKKRRIASKIVRYAFLALEIVSLALFAIELAGRERYDMPPSSDGPYITLGSIGIVGERGSVIYKDKTSGVERVPSQAAELWRTYECVVNASGIDAQLYQDIYIMRLPIPKTAVAEALMENAVFARGREDFDEVTVPGFERAWVGALEAVGITGDAVVSFTLITSGPSEAESEGLMELLAAYSGAFS